MSTDEFKPETAAEPLPEFVPPRVYRSGLHEVLAMASPAIAMMASASVMQFVDFLMVSSVGKSETAAVSPSGILVFVFISFFGGILSCTNTFVSQSFARRRYADCARYTWQGLYVAAAAGVAALALWPLAPFVMRAMGHAPHLQPLEVSYFRWRLLSIGSMASMSAMGGFFQGISRPRVTMYAAIVANALNIGINYVLIFGKLGFPALGIAGAGMATSLAAGVQVIILLSVFLSGSRARTFGTRGAWRWDAHRAGELLRVGAPAGVQWTLDVACWGIFIGVVVGRLGEDLLAASNIAGQLMHLSFLPTVGLGIATTALVGQNIGRRDFDTARARTRTTLAMGMGYMFLMGVVFFVFRRELVGFIREEPEIIDMGAQAMILAAFFQTFDAMGIILSSALKGAGDTRFPAMMSILFGWVIFLPASLVMTRVLDWGIVGAWGGATVYICALGVTLYWRWKRNTWEKIDIFRTKPFRPTEVIDPMTPHEPGEEIAGS
ncbi:MAG TPA: MATE family efflux transporter [Planctomycetota bacterium]|nr:MATE family efflux transporter [Planctomycetota bacterium]